MTLTEIAGLLVEYRAIKRASKDLRAELIKVCVEECGLAQNVAVKIAVDDFLDGYLVANGMNRKWDDE